MEGEWPWKKPDFKGKPCHTILPKSAANMQQSTEEETCYTRHNNQPVN
jgi:hypothetical protein